LPKSLGRPYGPAIVLFLCNEKKGARDELEMRIATIIFISIFTLITGLISFYIFIRGLQSIPTNSCLRSPFIIIFWTVALSFICGRLLESVLPYFLTEILVWVGSFWIAASLYCLLAVVALDLLRLVNHFLPFFPAAITTHYQQAKQILGVCVFGLVGIVLIAGHINSLLPRVVTLDLSIARKASKLKQLNIVAVSDIHLGTIVGRSRIDHIVERINSLDPDLVLLPGDIVDEDLAPVIKQNLGEALSGIKSRLGVFAVTGNHEYIGGVEDACRYLVAHHITMLRDQSVLIADSVFLVGREDRSSNRFPGGHPRKELAELMRSVDRNYPVILMDHQPFGLEEAVAQNIDLQISGHTHDGQLWPVNYIVDRVYELPWGYKKTGNTNFYVSDGVGTWGPPVRVGNRPEIVNIHVKFE
jgi:predicted MPP superfamily phosphohydrolase